MASSFKTPRKRTAPQDEVFLANRKSQKSICHNGFMRNKRVHGPFPFGAMDLKFLSIAR
jgi:hypothetical protein